MNEEKTFSRNIVVGQKVDDGKVQRARELRRQMTEEERMLWEAVRAKRLSGLHFRRQQVIHGFIVDFYCAALGLIIEVDGGVHDEQADYDAERDRILSELGLRILRVTNQEVRHNLAAVLARIAEEIPA